MAKPDTDDGWFKMAVELEAALNYADFTKVARVVIGYVFIQTFGRGTRPKLAYLPRKATADRIGQKRQNFDRAIQELIESGVLIEARDDQYRFQKDYEKWVTWNRDPGKCGQPRLTTQEVEECKKMPEYAESFRIKGSSDPQASDASNGMQDSHPTGCKTASNGMRPHKRNGRAS